MRFLLYRNKPYKRVNLNVDPRGDLREILNQLGLLTLPEELEESWPMAHIRCALLELIRNSQEAQRREGVSRPIQLSLAAAGPWEADDTAINPRGLPGLWGSVRDWGGGFSDEDLPFPLDTPLSTIDPEGPELTAYREKRNYQHFGLGLYTALKTFPGFRTEFFEEDGERGTLIQFFLPGETSQ